MKAQASSPFWPTFDRAGAAVRAEWVVRDLLREALDRPPGVAAAAGRGRLNDLRDGYGRLSPEGRTQFIRELLSGIPELAALFEYAAHAVPRAADVTEQLLLELRRDVADIRAALAEPPGSSAPKTLSRRYPIDQFVSSCVGKLPGARLPSMALHRAHVQWAHSIDVAPLTPKTLALTLKSLGYRAKKLSSMHWLDLELRDFAAPEIQPGAPTHSPRASAAPAAEIPSGARTRKRRPPNLRPTTSQPPKTGRIRP